MEIMTTRHPRVKLASFLAALSLAIPTVFCNAQEAEPAAPAEHRTDGVTVNGYQCQQQVFHQLTVQKISFLPKLRDQAQPAVVPVPFAAETHR